MVDLDQLDSSVKPVVTFFVVVGLWSWLADNFMFILSYEAGCYKLTVLKVHPLISGIIAQATMPRRLEHSIIFFIYAFDTNECIGLKNGLLTGGLELETSQS